jgi:hypothetical protein
MPVDTPVEDHDSPSPDPDSAPSGSDRSVATAGRWAFRTIAAIIILASFAVWGYTYYLHLNRPEPPDFLADATLAPAADEICSRTVAAVAQVPGASEAATAQERAQQVTASTDLFDAMVAELAAFSPTDDRDQVIWEGFVGDWEILVDDRQRFAEALQTDPEAQFLLTAIAGERLDRRISRVAEANKMYSCVAPDDV